MSSTRKIIFAKEHERIKSNVKLEIGMRLRD